MPHTLTPRIKLDMQILVPIADRIPRCIRHRPRARQIRFHHLRTHIREIEVPPSTTIGLSKSS